MALSLITGARAAGLTAQLITACGAGALAKFFTGTRTLGTPGGTLLGTVTFGSVIGTISSVTLTFGAVTQTNTSHVTGTPTFVQLCTSAGVVQGVIDIGAGAGNLQISAAITNGQDIGMTGATIVAGNA